MCCQSETIHARNFLQLTGACPMKNRHWKMMIGNKVCILYNNVGSEPLPWEERETSFWSNLSYLSFLRFLLHSMKQVIFRERGNGQWLYMTSDFTAWLLKHLLWKKCNRSSANVETKLFVYAYINKTLWKHWMHQNKFFCHLQHCKDNGREWSSSRHEKCRRRCEALTLTTETSPRRTDLILFGTAAICPCCVESHISAESPRPATPCSLALALHSDLITHIYCRTVIHISLDFVGASAVSNVHCHGSQSCCDTCQPRRNCIFPCCKAATEMEAMKLVSLSTH